MNACPSQEELSAYVDGEIEAPRASEIAEHLKSCRRCRARAEEFAMVTNRLRERTLRRPQAAEKEAVWHNVRRASHFRRAERTQPAHRRLARLLVPLAAAAIFALVMFWPGLIHNGTRGPSGNGKGDIASAVCEVEVFDDSIVKFEAAGAQKGALVWFMAPTEASNGGAS